jgi:hypothetical protein
MILSIQKFSASFTGTEALKIHKYLHLGNFLWVATDPRMIQASKASYYFFQEAYQVASPGRLPRSRLAQRSNAVECNNLYKLISDFHVDFPVPGDC